MAALVDTRLLGRPTTFAGEDESSWIAWAFVFKAYCGAVDDNLQNAVETAEVEPNEIAMTALGPVHSRMSRQLYHMLAMLLTGRAQRIMMRVEVGNGYEVWRRLKLEFDPTVPGRTWGLVWEMS